EYLNDLDEEYQASSLLAKSKRFFKKVTQRFSSTKATDQTECHKCGKKGHFVRDCWSKTSVPSYQSTFQPKPLSFSQHKPDLRPTKDFEAKYNKIKAKLALLSSSTSDSKAATTKNKGRIAEACEWDEEEVSSDDNEMVEVKVLMALAEDDDAVSKEGARNDNQGLSTPGIDTFVSSAEDFTKTRSFFPELEGSLALVIRPLFFTIEALQAEALELRSVSLALTLLYLALKFLEGLSLPKLTLTCMTLELMDRSVFKPIGIAKDVSVKVRVFHFSADFVVVDFKPDPRVPLILGRCLLKIDRALIDVHKGELTLRIRNEAIIYNLDQTSRYSANYNQMTANKIDVICEMYSQEVLGLSDTTASANPTPYDDPIVSTTSHILTLFGDSVFLLFEEANAFLGLEDDPNSPEFDPSYYDPEGDILLLEAILNSEPLHPLPNHDQYLPSFKKKLKVCEAKMVKSSFDEPLKVELKDLPPHLEYAFLEGNNNLPVIISKELGDEDKSALIKVLQSHKRAIAWKLSDIHVQHQRRVNPKIHKVIKKEVEKLLDVGLIYPISDSPWVSPVHCVPKKGGFTVVENEENELIPTRLVTDHWVSALFAKASQKRKKSPERSV
nr:transposon Ty3-I Gag-Pol polyprotein [Tanacetum cinerariifolium]